MDNQDNKTVQFTGKPAEQPANVSQAATPVEPVQQSGGALSEEQIRRLVQSEKDKLAAQLRETLVAELRQPATAKAEAPAAQPAGNEGKALTPAHATAQGGGANPQHDLINNLQLDLEAEFGMVVEDQDPEAQSIVQTDATQYLRTYRAALKAKAERLKAQPPTTSPQARVPLAGGAGSSVSPIQNINDPAVLLRMGLNGK